MPLRLSVLPLALSICHLQPDEIIPAWAYQSSFFSITKTGEELSIVCDETVVPEGIKRVSGWRAFKVEGPLDFSLTGILSSLTAPLAEKGIPVFAVSTFDTDYLLVEVKYFEQAKGVLGEEFILS